MLATKFKLILKRTDILSAHYKNISNVQDPTRKNIKSKESRICGYFK